MNMNKSLRNKFERSSKHILSNPYKILWPQIDFKVQEKILQELLSFFQNFENLNDKYNKNFSYINKEKLLKNQKRKQKSELFNFGRHLVFGINQINKMLEYQISNKLEESSFSLVFLVIDKSSPWQFHKHLIQLCFYASCPCVAINNLSNNLSPFLPVSKMCVLGFKNPNFTYLDLSTSSMMKNFSSENKVKYESIIKNNLRNLLKNLICLCPPLSLPWSECETHLSDIEHFKNFNSNLESFQNEENNLEIFSNSKNSKYYETHKEDSNFLFKNNKTTQNKNYSNYFKNYYIFMQRTNDSFIGKAFYKQNICQNLIVLKKKNCFKKGRDDKYFFFYRNNESEKRRKLLLLRNVLFERSINFKRINLLLDDNFVKNSKNEKHFNEKSNSTEKINELISGTSIEETNWNCSRNFNINPEYCQRNFMNDKNKIIKRLSDVKTKKKINTYQYKDKKRKFIQTSIIKANKNQYKKN